ncbi:NAD(P)H-dependent oxidoreductase [Thalassotalea nanhaiensis]|uniref:NAD(P)H-dependent oxidoreductase n=1 Tax=Thalassotalea nanhaiensis TaxID=3065648 RepID=A0ABY9TE18_9GAMM|nr:NAD(P)H-dependent oxidoreductase [Colwelliaceae bacterium SQ345]
MNTLVIFAHPDVENGSIGNKIILDELNKNKDIKVRELYKLYPDFNIDVEAEQAALREADVVVFQFPFFWYSCPALLKKWMDDVLLYGFAYGSTGKELRGKELLLSVTIGGAADSYKPDGYNTFLVEDFILPFKQTANLTEMLFNDDFIYSHGMINIPGIDYPRQTTQAIAYKHADKLITELKARMSGDVIQKEFEAKKAPVYFLGQVDVKEFEPYMSQYGMPVVGQLMERGVEILSATADTQIKEGEWPNTWDVLFKFPSQDDFDDFWDSEAYAPFKKIRREELTHGGNVVIMPAFDPDSL